MLSLFGAAASVDIDLSESNIKKTIDVVTVRRCGCRARGGKKRKRCAAHRRRGAARAPLRPLRGPARGRILTLPVPRPTASHAG